MLRGIGPKITQRLARLGVHTLGDLASHLPRSYQEYRHVLTLAQVQPGSDVCVRATVARIGRFRYRGRPTPTITITDSAGDVAMLYAFGRPQLGRTVEKGQNLIVCGRFEWRGNMLSASRFELTRPEEEDGRALVPVYPATTGLSQRTLRRLVEVAVASGASSARFRVPGALLTAHRMPQKSEALVRVHRPRSFEEAEEARRALAYEELFLLQLTLLQRSPAGRPRPRRQRRGGRLKAALLGRLPFELTAAQEGALTQIETDLFGKCTSARLLQGDVGCGKTLVALLAAACVVEAGQQVVILAPSEALCFQHAETASRLLEPAGVRLGLLSGSTDRAARAHLLPALAAGKIDVLLSTHAVLEDTVRFAELGLVVIDEQHKFGVAQRAAVAAKAAAGDLILMTATPIPRTLALTFYGDLTVTSIDQMPPGRQPIRTHLVRAENRERVFRHVESELSRGHQAYFVCPKIGGDDSISARPDSTSDLYLANTDLAAGGEPDGSNDSVLSLYASLQRRFNGYRISLAHAGMDAAAQRRTLSAFHAGAIDVLVATTVVEVGLDVTNATCMVVEHAERFGLAALHQLRGRVGRGRYPSYAFFVYGADLSPQAVERLRALNKCDDGFALADLDLSLRGPGELAGVRQAGVQPLRAARLASDLDLMRQAQTDVRRYRHAIIDTAECIRERTCG